MNLLEVREGLSMGVFKGVPEDKAAILRHDHREDKIILSFSCWAAWNGQDYFYGVDRIFLWSG